MLALHLDENVDPEIARQLRARGVDVTTSQDAELLGAVDESQFAFACATGRVLVTHDRDFHELVREGSDHPGLAFSVKDDWHLGELVRWLELLAKVYEPSDLRGRTEYCFRA